MLKKIITKLQLISLAWRIISSIKFAIASKLCQFFTVWIKASVPKDSYFCLFFVCFGSLSNGFILREDNCAMEMGLHTELSRATGEAMNFQGNTTDLEIFQMLKNLALYYFFYWWLWSQMGWIWMACPAHTFFRRLQLWNKDGNTYATDTKLHNQQLALLCPLNDSKLNVSQFFTEVGYFLVSTSFIRHERC